MPVVFPKLWPHCFLQHGKHVVQGPAAKGSWAATELCHLPQVHSDSQSARPLSPPEHTAASTAVSSAAAVLLDEGPRQPQAVQPAQGQQEFSEHSSALDSALDDCNWPTGSAAGQLEPVQVPAAGARQRQAWQTAQVPSDFSEHSSAFHDFSTSSAAPGQEVVSPQDSPLRSPFSAGADVGQSAESSPARSAGESCAQLTAPCTA